MRKLALLMTSVIAVIFLTSLTSAYFWACFSKGEKINYCNPDVPDRTCYNSAGCPFCMSSYNETKNCFNGGGDKCNFIPR